MPGTRKVSATCPICKNQFDVDVDVDLVEKSEHYPVSVVLEHGKPSHFMILYLDAQFRVRGVDGHSVKLTEKTMQDPIDIALEEKKNIKRLAEAPDLLDDLNLIIGVEFVDTKGIAVVSLSRAGLTIGPIMSPSGRLKARFIIANEEQKKVLESKLVDALKSIEDAAPLSPVTLCLLLKVIEESIKKGCELEPILLKNVVQSHLVLPVKLLKSNVFDVMWQHTLTEDTGIREIALIKDRFDGNTSLLTMLRQIEKKGLSQIYLLRGLEKLREEEAVRFAERDEALMR